jgi:hypothetical protein
MVHEDAPHYLGTQRQEMSPVFAVYSSGAFQLEIRLVGERGGLEALAGAPMRKVVVRDPTQFRINQLDQMVQRVPIAGVPSGEHSGDIVMAPVRQACRILAP